MSFWGKMTGSEKQSTGYKGYGGSSGSTSSSNSSSGAGRGDQSRNAEAVRKANAAAAKVLADAKNAKDAKDKRDIQASIAAAEKVQADKVKADAAAKVALDAAVMKRENENRAKAKAETQAKVDKVQSDQITENRAEVNDEPTPSAPNKDSSSASDGGTSESTFRSVHKSITPISSPKVTEYPNTPAPGRLTKEAMLDLPNPEDLDVFDYMAMRKAYNPESGVWSRWTEAIGIRFEAAPADLLLDNVGVLLNPIAGLVTNLASEPIQRALDDRSRGESLLADVGQTIKENPGTILAATVEGAEMIGSLVQYGIDTDLGKIPDKSIGDIMAPSLLGPLIGSVVEDINPFDNKYLNMATQIGLTVAGVSYGASAIDGIANGPNSPSISPEERAYRTGKSLLLGSGGGGSSSQISIVPQASPSLYTPYTPEPIAATSINRFKSGTEEEEEIFSSPFASKVSRKESKNVLGTRAFDSSMQETNTLGFGTGKTLNYYEDPSDQFSTRQRTSGGQYEEDTVSFLARRSI
jgi:hypothetical protein